MKAYRMKIEIRDHRLAADLPPEIPDGEAEIIMLYEGGAAENATPNAGQPLGEFLSGLDHTPLPRRHTKEEVDSYLAQERASWE